MNPHPEKPRRRPKKHAKLNATTELHELLDLVSPFIEARHKANLTQEEVGIKMGVGRDRISRLESLCRTSHTLSFLRSYAKALGYELKIELIRPGSSVGRAGD